MWSRKPRPSITASRSSSPFGWAAGTSVLLHAMVLAAILLWLGNERPADPAPTPFVELRLVEAQGAGPAASPSPPTPPAETAAPAQRPTPQPAPEAPQPAPPPPPPSPPAVAAAEPVAEPLPLPPPPAPPSQPANARPAPKPVPPAPVRPPEMNLGGGDSLANVTATGPAVLPAKVDAHWHNREPAYPPSAAQRGEAGTVLLLIHVGPDGAVTGLDVERSSGFLLLDRAARQAVATWHFIPAVKDGAPVASDMPLRVVFQLN